METEGRNEKRICGGNKRIWLKKLTNAKMNFLLKVLWCVCVCTYICRWKINTQACKCWLLYYNSFIFLINPHQISITLTYTRMYVHSFVRLYIPSISTLRLEIGYKDLNSYIWSCFRKVTEQSCAKVFIH